MKRVSIYLDEEHLELLRRLSEQRAEPVAALVRTVIDSWLETQGARRLDDAEWTRRFERLLTKRSRLAKEAGFAVEEVERDVMRTVTEVRRAKAARRR